MGCCGGRSPKGAKRPLHGGVPRAAAAAIPTPAAADMVKMIYVGTRQGDFRLTAQPTRQQYYVPGQGQFVEIDQTGVQGVQPPDVAWFRSVSQGQDFKIVDPPAVPSVVPQPAPEPEPVAAKAIPVDSKAWAPEVMEMERPADMVEHLADIVTKMDIERGQPLPKFVDRPTTISITEAAQELALEHGIDWTTLRGSGKDGSILVKDVRAAIG